MKRVLVILLAIALTAAVSATGFAAEEKEAVKYGPNVGDNFKPFTLSDPVNHKSVALASMLGKKKNTILFFMNTTCSLCLAEEKMFLESWDKMKEKVNLLLLSVDFDPSRIEAYAKTQEIPFTILHDPEGEVLGNAGFTGTPALVVVDPEGKIKEKISGYDQNAVKGYIRKLTR
jgi:peroxiredoxin